jgi:hypothetical protein
MSHAISLERLGIGGPKPSYARMDLFALRLQECKVDIAAPAQNLQKSFARATRRSGSEIV